MTNNKNTAYNRIINSALRAYPNGIKTAWWLIKITVPVSFAMMLLNHYGILNIVGRFATPFFALLNLPGVAAIILIMSIFTNVYSVVAVLALLNLPMREGVIIATMCLVSHNFVIENIVMKRTGSSFWEISLVRILGSLAVAAILNFVLPGGGAVVSQELPVSTVSLSDAIYHWLMSSGGIVLKIFIIINVLLFIQELLEEFGVIPYIVRIFSPLMRMMGLPQNTTFSWVVANIVGLAYGSAIMIDQSQKGKMNRQDADVLNHHIALSHSQLEDPLLFLTLGYPMLPLIIPRVLIAIISVWIYRFGRRIWGDGRTCEVNN